MHLNADGGKWAAHADTKCHRFYLNDFDLEGEPIAGRQTESFDFCIPPFTNYLTVEMVRACGVDGFWIRDRKGCVQTFAPETVGVFKFIKVVGFAQFLHFVKVPWSVSVRPGFVFFRDSCTLDKKRRTLKCEMNQIGGAHIYHLSPQLVPYPHYEMKSGCSVD